MISAINCKYVKNVNNLKYFKNILAFCYALIYTIISKQRKQSK